MTVGTLHLERGAVIFTSPPISSDYGIPVVEPIRRKKGRCARRVRNVVRCQGGVVVFFADGHKSKPVNGKTVWLMGDADLLTEVRR